MTFISCPKGGIIFPARFRFIHEAGKNYRHYIEATFFGLPSILITDPRVRWEPVDDVTAVLVVPFGQGEEHFIVRFDPETSLLSLLESMRYKGDSSAKILWLNNNLAWNNLNGYQIPTVGTVTWFDEGSPWAVFTGGEVVYNVDVQDYIRAKGI